MNPQFTIKNFRVFDEEGATFELAPVTVLTGCNSSGKSSMVKAMMLFEDVMNDIRNNIVNWNKCELSKYKIDFSKKQYNLGKYNLALNKNAGKNSKISFEYTFESLILVENVSLKLSFVSSEEDEMNYGWLSNLEIYKTDGTCVFAIEIVDSRIKISTINIKCVRRNFANYMKILCACVALANSSYVSGNIKTPGNITRRVDDDKSISEHEKYILFNVITKSFDDNIGKFKKSQLIDLYNFACRVSNGESYYYPSIFDELKGKGIDDNKVLTIEYLTKKKDELQGFNEPSLFNVCFENFIEAFKKSNTSSIIKFFACCEEEKVLQYLNRDYSNDDLFDEINGFFISYCGDYSFSNGLFRILSKTSTSFTNVKNKDFSVDAAYVLSILSSENNEVNKPGFSSYKWIHSFFIDFLRFTLTITLNATYMPSSRAIVKRLYNIDDKSNEFGVLIQKYFDAKKNCLNEYVPNTFLNKWIRKFEIGNSVVFKSTEEGLGILAFIEKKDGSEKCLLADEGYGVTQLVAILLQIETLIMSTPQYVNYKTTFLEDYSEEEAKYLPTLIAIEEPEIHLHPRFQSLLADMFVDAYKTYNIRFIVETHSEYIIRKLQTIVARNMKDSNDGLAAQDVSISYMYSPNPSERPKNEKQVKRINIKDDGCLKEPFGAGFFDEADNLSMDLLTIKVGK